MNRTCGKCGAIGCDVAFRGIIPPLPLLTETSPDGKTVTNITAIRSETPLCNRCAKEWFKKMKGEKNDTD